MGGGGGRTVEAAVAGGVSKIDGGDAGAFRQRSALLWKVFKHESNDELVIRPDQQDLATTWKERALRYYSLRLELFPDKDFYEEAERDHFTAEVAKIENGNEDGEDQFTRRLRNAREIANDNARMLYCELAPLMLFLLLGWQVVNVLFDPFHLLAGNGAANMLPPPFAPFAAAILSEAWALGFFVILLAGIYRFSFANVQMQNAQELNSFIQTEFTCLNQSFNVARSECMQAESRVDRNQHDNIEPYATAWAGAYHWIAIRQLSEELIIRNNMFQIRRNTWLYKMFGLAICVVLGIAMIVVTLVATGAFNPDANILALGLELLAATLLFIALGYGLIMRRAFEMIRDRLPTEEWSRLYKLRVGEAIAEQVGRDKKNIVLLRDRSAG
ncbi:MAG: hypothetical protein NT015_06130 [Alphaproteobacteria bacterium]|nr:hypothetical protein [Alphaproteobacteria bacterium]